MTVPLAGDDMSFSQLMSYAARSFSPDAIMLLLRPGVWIDSQSSSSLAHSVDSGIAKDLLVSRKVPLLFLFRLRVNFGLVSTPDVCDAGVIVDGSASINLGLCEMVTTVGSL